MGLKSRNADARNHCRNCAAAHPALFRAHSCEEAVERQKYINSGARAQCTACDYEALLDLPDVKRRRMAVVSEEHRAAIDVDRLPSDRAGLLGTQKKRSTCNFVRSLPAALQDRLEKARKLILLTHVQFSR